MTALSLGKRVEQWLGTSDHIDYVIIKYLEICRGRDLNYSVHYIEVFDDGDEEFTDIGEFSVVDSDEFYVEHIFATFEEALRFSIGTYGCRMDRFVNGGLIEGEYMDYLKSRKSK